MSGEIPAGHGSVFHFLDIFALGCGLEAAAGLHKGDPLWMVGAWIGGAIAFHLVGTNWPLIHQWVGPLFSSILYWTASVASVFMAISIILYVSQLRDDLDAYVMPRRIT